MVLVNYEGVLEVRLSPTKKTVWYRTGRCGKFRRMSKSKSVRTILHDNPGGAPLYLIAELKGDQVIIWRSNADAGTFFAGKYSIKDGSYSDRLKS